jgi:hypothetical protein
VYLVHTVSEKILNTTHTQKFLYIHLSTSIKINTKVDILFQCYLIRPGASIHGYWKRGITQTMKGLKPKLHDLALSTGENKILNLKDIISL